MDAAIGLSARLAAGAAVIHVGVTPAMIVVILLQRSEGGGLGMGGTDALFSVRGQANVLSRTTAIFAGIFFFLSLIMALEHGRSRQDRRGRSWIAPAATPDAPGAAAAAGGAEPRPPGTSPLSAVSSAEASPAE